MHVLWESNPKATAWHPFFLAADSILLNGRCILHAGYCQNCNLAGQAPAKTECSQCLEGSVLKANKINTANDCETVLALMQTC